MADISGYLKTIKNAGRGEEVRDAIISALQKLTDENPTKLKALSVTMNGTYVASNGVAYNSVTVNVPDQPASSLRLVEETFTENGEFEPDEGEVYSKVNIEVPQYVNEILDEITITANGDYVALMDGYDGYGTVHVKVETGGSGTYTVKFMAVDRTTVLQTVINVPYGGGCIYSGATPTSTGMRFVGWTPNPTYITADTNCYPRFEDPIVDDTLITDDWVTIAKKVRQDPDAYNIGQWKLMEFTPFTDHRDIVRTPLSVQMQLVAKGVDPLEGENGYAPTTWIARDRTLGFAIRMDDNTIVNGWSECELRLFLLDEFWKNSFPAEIREYLRPVIKYSSTLLSDREAPDYPSIDYLWIPSWRELTGDTTRETKGPTYHDTAFPNSYGRSYNYWLRSWHGGIQYAKDLVNRLGYGSDYYLETANQILLGFCL